MSECTPAELRPEWTHRKRQVLELLARGKTNAEIAEALGLTLAGAKWHVSEVLSILNVESREEAAEYWRREHSLRRRVNRAARALAAPVFSAKTAVGATGLAAVVGGSVVMAGLSSDTGPVSGDSAATTATPLAAPVGPRGLDLDYVDILALPRSNGGTETLAASLGDELCFRTSRSWEPNGLGFGCYGPKAGFEPTLIMALGGGRPAVYSGSVPVGTAKVVLELYEGGPVEPALVAPPPSAGLDMLFWAAEVPRGEWVAKVTSFDASGAMVDSVDVYDAPGTPPRPQVTAPLSDLILVGSNRADPHSGTIPFGGARRGAIADPAGGRYRFQVEHDGTTAPALHFWCATGFQQLAWESGPDAVGNGILHADVPPNSAGCQFLVVGGDGTYRISAISGP